ncbi:MAG: hypothetical protein RIT45_3039 [Pseudomonadota bacterium]|jgi:UDP-2-acetamido-3-amino-2,3-dideoxy-glucuronate N-acetyltransferase
MTSSPAPTVPRVTLIGLGPWGRNLARNLYRRGALAGIVDPSPDAARVAAADYADVPLFGTLEAAPVTEAVVIAAPAARHAALVRACLDRGSHVFVEKPLALELVEGRELVARAEAAGLRLMVGHLLHYHPAIEALAGLCADGTLGRLRYLYSNRLNLGRFRREESSLWSFAPHDVAVLLRLCGALPERVVASGASFLHPRVADTTMTLLEWDSGIAAHIYVSWLHPFKEQRLVVVGEDAMAVFDDRASEHKLVLYRHGVDWRDGRPVPRRADAEPVPLADEEPLGREVDAFLAWVRDPSARPPSDGAEGLRVLSVLDAAQRSVERRGEPMAPRDPSAGTPRIHPTALVGSGAIVGDGTAIWHFCHVMDGASIGRGCVLGQNGFVAGGARIGDRVRLQNNVSVYDGVVLEDDVFVGPSAVFTNVNRPRAHVSRRDAYATTRVGRGATIGANATVVCGHTIGAHAFVGAGAVVTHDVPEQALVVGNPARVVGWVCRCGERVDLPAQPTPDAAAECERCGRETRFDADAGHARTEEPA